MLKWNIPSSCWLFVLFFFFLSFLWKNTAKMWRKHIRKSEYICQSKSLSFKKLPDTIRISSIIHTCTQGLDPWSAGEECGKREEEFGGTDTLAPDVSLALSRVLPAGSCLLPGREHPPGPAAYVLHFWLGEGKTKPCNAWEEQAPHTGKNLLTSISLRLEKSWISRIFVKLCAQALGAISTECV